MASSASMTKSVVIMYVMYGSNFDVSDFSQNPLVLAIYVQMKAAIVFMEYILD